MPCYVNIQIKIKPHLIFKAELNMINNKSQVYRFKINVGGIGALEMTLTAIPMHLERNPPTA